MRVARALFLPVCLVLLLTAAATVPLPLFVERPQTPVSLGGHVEVAVDGGGQLDGDFLLPLVNLRRATVFWLLAGLADRDMRLVPATRLTGGQQDADFFARQRSLFSETADLAAALALEAAGFEVDYGEPEGVLVAGILPGAPAEGALEVGDVVTAVDGVAVRSVDELLRVLARAGPSVQLDLLREGRALQVAVRTGTVPGLAQPGLGVRPDIAFPPIELPVPVEIDSGRVGGPSAGLMVALTVYDLASPDDVAGGRRIAGTGTIEPDGSVGPVGGVGLKVLAAHRDGADLFLVPSVQRDDALAGLPEGSTLEVVAVDSLAGALDALDVRDTTLIQRSGRVIDTTLMQRAAVAAAAATRIGTLQDPPWSAPGG